MRELMHGVVDGRERYRHRGRHGLLMQSLRCEMAVAMGEQKLSQGKPLARWPKPCLAQPIRVMASP
jgi:hypothetical protein